MNGTTLNIHEKVVAAFLVTNKTNRVKFFKKIFLLANVGPDVVFEMFFLTLSNANINNFTLNKVCV